VGKTQKGNKDKECVVLEFIFSFILGKIAMRTTLQELERKIESEIGDRRTPS